MDSADHLRALREEGDALARAADAAGNDALLPSCPGWAMRDLLAHLGEVHRWAAAVVSAPLPSLRDLPGDFLGPMPSDERLLPWFREGHQRVIDALDAAPPDLVCAVFLADTTSPRHFWARRQAHEASMHRVDAQLAIDAPQPIEARLAADGIDEMLTGFVPRSRTPLHSDAERRLQVVLDDDPAAWVLTIGPERPHTARGGGDADCTVRGAASDVLCALWNRPGVDRLAIEGNASLLHQFTDQVRITWS